MVDRERIKSEGLKIIAEFSEKLKNVPDTEETHYVVDLRNVRRMDGKPIPHDGFREKFKKLAPKWSEGSLVAEKGQ